MATLFRSEADETDRVLALSDGVIAIVITLLVLDLTVPQLPPGSPESALVRLVARQWPEFLGFVLSFWVIGLYWVQHRRTFIHIETHERGVVFLNLLFLLLVSFVPYATSVFTTYPSQFGVTFVSAVLALTGTSLALLWAYASQNDLLGAGLTSRTVTIQAARYLASPLVFGVAILVAVLDAQLAILMWGLLLPLNGALQSRLIESFDGETA